MRVSRRAFLYTAVTAAAAGVPPWSTAASAQETAIGVDSQFQGFYDRMGGADVLGNPLTVRYELDGRQVQLFENFLLEHWPENSGTDYEVQPALLGVRVSGARYFGQAQPFGDSSDVIYVPDTRQSLRLGFLSFWRDNGGADLFGYPISEEVMDGGVTAQWFQRGKLTYDSERTPSIQIADLGRTWQSQTQDGLAATYAADAPGVRTPGGSAQVRLAITNSGSDTWPSTGDDAVTLGFRWADRHPPRDREPPASISLSADVAASEMVELETSVTLPDSPGQYRLQPDLHQSGEWFTSKGVEAAIIACHAELAVPEMRVGLLDISDDNPGVTAATINSTKGLRILDEGGSEIGALTGDQSVVIKRDIPGERQVLDLPGDVTESTAGRVSIVPLEGSMLRLAETEPWQTYRGSFEFAWLARYQSAWLVNILPLDDYLSGIAEQGDYIAWEALRASAIAFRSFALATRTERRASNLLFDAAGSTHHTPTMYTRHQVYHGMAREFSGTRLREAVADTHGQVMTYDGETIMAVYFSRADGRTRSWHEEWGGARKPWAIGVPDSYSEGQTLLGHGIGLPLRSANAMAETGANGEQILASYYSEIDFGAVY